MLYPARRPGTRRDGESSLQSFYRRYQSEKVVPLHLEWKFTLPVGKHFITGFVDRIDPLGDGTCSILDYKTGKPRPQKDVDVDDQLTIYALAVLECLGLRADRLSQQYVMLCPLWFGWCLLYSADLTIWNGDGRNGSVPHFRFAMRYPSTGEATTGMCGQV